nr:hypothetical protein [Tanacetum cinerariifolium]
MSSDSHATVTYTSMSSYEVTINEYYGMPMDPLDPYVQLVMGASPSPDYIPGPEVPPSPDYIPGPEAPPSPDYIPGPEYLEYLPPADDMLPADNKPLPAAVSPTAESPGYFMESKPEMDKWEPDCGAGGRGVWRGKLGPLMTESGKGGGWEEENIFSQDYTYSQDYSMGYNLGHGSTHGSDHSSAPVNNNVEDDSPLEEVSPIKPKQPSRHATRAKKDAHKELPKDWTVAEETALCQAWCDVFENNIVRHNTNTSGFLDAIITYFEKETRSTKGYDSIVSKWNNMIRPRSGAFCAIIHNVEANHESDIEMPNFYNTQRRKKSKTSKTSSESASGGIDLNDEADE